MLCFYTPHDCVFNCIEFAKQRIEFMRLRRVDLYP